MEYTENIDQALEYANQAIAKMREIGVPSNPHNFTIWFHYYSGTYPDLKRTLDILLGNQQTFDEARSAEIFQKFFTLDQESATLHDATNRAEAELGRIVSSLGLAGGDLHALTEKLMDAQKTLDTVEDRDSVRQISNGLSQSVSSVVALNQSLESSLKASADEIHELKDELERMRREAMTDGLTGIANRKFFELELRKAAMNAMTNGDDLVLVLFDVDNFNRFNDHFGHQVGDQVLKLMAMTISECVKGQDTPARYGGDEFAVVLPHTNLENGLRLSETICKRVSSKAVVNRSTGERLGKMTMSAGVAVFEYGEPINQLLVRADRALQQARAMGNNKIVTQADLEGSSAA